MKKSESTIALVNRLVTNIQHRARVFEAIAKKENEGYSYQNAEASLELLVIRLLNGKKLPFIVTDYHVSLRGSETSHECEASVKVIVRGALFHRVSDGNGPISALDGALRLALEDSFPQLRTVRLDDYSVGLVGNLAGADSKTRVLVVTADNERRWGTVGVSQNVVEASLSALADGLEYALLPRPK